MYKANSNYSLIKKYLSALAAHGYLEASASPSPRRFRITLKGERFLRLLSGLDDEMNSLKETVSRREVLVKDQFIKGSKDHFEKSRVPSASMVPKSLRFMQSVMPETHLELVKIAQEKGTNVQGLLRATIIPEWFRGRSEKLASNDEYFRG